MSVRTNRSASRRHAECFRTPASGDYQLLARLQTAGPAASVRKHRALGTPKSGKCDTAGALRDPLRFAAGRSLAQCVCEELTWRLALASFTATWPGTGECSMAVIVSSCR